jgi:acetyl-CoA carboxylase biotin carboxyl carrier protein
MSDVAITTGKKIMAEILAPLAGKIVDVLVTVGTAITEDDELIVIEALKMENLVYASGEGTVKEVRVKKGDSVSDGDVLLVIA